LIEMLERKRALGVLEWFYVLGKTHVWPYIPKPTRSRGGSAAELVLKWPRTICRDRGSGWFVAVFGGFTNLESHLLSPKASESLLWVDWGLYSPWRWDSRCRLQIDRCPRHLGWAADHWRPSWYSISHT
jgi:hypothetical protein